MGKQLISNRQIKTYQKTVDSLRESLGRVIQVYVGSGIPTGNWDPVNNEPIDPNEPIQYDWTIFTVEKALVRWLGPEDYVQTSGGKIEIADAKVKCRLDEVLMSGTDVNNDTIFDHANHIIVDGQRLKVKGKPRKTGLRDLYMVEVFLERSDL
jgi:hypothetical protein